MNKNDRNYYIDFLKFIFSVIIVFYHSWVFSGTYGNGIFNNGYFAVDFYFIVTGYLLMNTINKEKSTRDSLGISTFKFIKNKFKRIIPYVILSFILGYIFIYGKSGLNLSILLSNSTIAEFFQIGIFGFGLNINSACWYISTMFFVLLIFYPIAKKNKENFTYLIIPIFILFTLVFINFNNININDPLGIKYLFINGFYKGIIFTSLGVICYEISQYLKNIKTSNKQKWTFTIIETLIYLILIYNMNNLKIGSILVAILFTFNIAVTFSNQSYMGSLFKSKKWQELGKFGFIIFLNNCAVRTFLLNKNYGFSYYKMLIIYFSIVIIISFLSYILIEIVLKKRYSIKKHIKTPTKYRS